MCYPLPGPRCSAHARKAVIRARQAYEAEPKSSPRRVELYGAYLDRRSEFFATPAGQRWLEDKIATSGDIDGSYARFKEQGILERKAAMDALKTKRVQEQSQAWGKDSVVKDTDGNPLKVYHGSGSKFEEFDSAYLGRGNDAYGAGFYFSDQRSSAEGYANDSNSPDAHVKEVHLNLVNPIMINGTKEPNLDNIEFTPEDIVSILKKHPGCYIQPNNEDGEMSFLGDYSEEYWEKDSFTREEMDAMVDKVAREHFSNANWVNLEVAFGREHAADFVKAVHETTGHDGVVVDFGEEGKHYVAWFPEQIRTINS